MGEVRPIPTLGGVVRDIRGAGRALRVSWHQDGRLVVLSLWDGPRCTGTVRLDAADVPALIEALQIGLQSERVAPPPTDETPELDVVPDGPADGADPAQAADIAGTDGPEGSAMDRPDGDATATGNGVGADGLGPGA